MSKHTRGPLEVAIAEINGSDMTGLHWAVKTEGPTSEALCITGFVGEGGEEEERSIADAHLYAAAPDMLEALEEVMRGHGIYDTAVAKSAGRAMAEIYMETGDKIRAAIRKAKGEA